MTYEINGQPVTPEEYYAHHGTPEWLQPGWLPTTHTYEGHDPLVSDGLGCMKAQVPEMREVIRRHNIQGVQVLPSGQLHITSRRGRRELMRVRGLADADAGYSD